MRSCNFCGGVLPGCTVASVTLRCFSSFSRSSTLIDSGVDDAAVDVGGVVGVGIGDGVSVESSGDSVVDFCVVDDSGVVVSGKPMVVWSTDGFTSVFVGIGDAFSVDSSGDVVVEVCGVGVEDSSVVVSAKPIVVCSTDGVISVFDLSSKLSFVLFLLITSNGSIGTGTTGSTLPSPVGFIVVLTAEFISVVVESVDIFAIGRESLLGLSMTAIVVFSSLIVVVCTTENGSVDVGNVCVVTSSLAFVESAIDAFVTSSLGLGPNVVDMTLEVSAGISGIAVVDVVTVEFSSSPKDTSFSDKNTQCASSSPPRQST